MGGRVITKDSILQFLKLLFLYIRNNDNFD